MLKKDYRMSRPHKCIWILIYFYLKRFKVVEVQIIPKHGSNHNKLEALFVSFLVVIKVLSE